MTTHKSVVDDILLKLEVQWVSSCVKEEFVTEEVSQVVAGRNDEVYDDEQVLCNRASEVPHS